MNFKQLMAKYVVNPDEIEAVKGQYYQKCFSFQNPNYLEAEAKKAFDTLCMKFKDIFEICVTEANVSETATISVEEMSEHIPRVGFHTNLTKLDFTFGLFRNFYLVTELKNSHNLKYMKDDFWHLIFQLSDIGEFKFKESEKPSSAMRSKYPQLFSKQGNFYKLLRNYFLFEVEHNRIRSLGHISVSWPNKTPIRKIIVNTCEAFKLLYQINLLLWRVDNKAIKL